MNVSKAASTAYDRVSRAKDHGAPGPSPDRAAQRAAQDVVMDTRHRGFDLSAQDRHAKYERAHFAVVGEGTRSACENFRHNFDLIDWST